MGGKGGKKSVDKKGKIKRGKKKTSAVWKNYKIEGEKLVRLNKLSPKATGVFMAEHKDRRTCGKTGYMEKK